MYVNPIIAGSVVTIMVEIVLVIGFALFAGSNKNNKNK